MPFCTELCGARCLPAKDYLHTCASVWYMVTNLLNYIQPGDYDFLDSIQGLNLLQELCAASFTPHGGTVGASRGEFPHQSQRTPAAPRTLRLPPGPRGRRGHLPSSSVLSCSSIRVQSMREMTPFCRAGVGGQRWDSKPQPSRGRRGSLPQPPTCSPAPQPGAGRCHRAPGATTSTERDLSGKKQFLTAGASVFLVQPINCLFINYLI